MQHSDYQPQFFPAGFTPYVKQCSYCEKPFTPADEFFLRTVEPAVALYHRFGGPVPVVCSEGCAISLMYPRRYKTAGRSTVVFIAN